MSKRENKGIPKPIIAVIQIGIVMLAILLFSMLNHFFIKFEPVKEVPTMETSADFTKNEEEIGALNKGHTKQASNDSKTEKKKKKVKSKQKKGEKTKKEKNKKKSKKNKSKKQPKHEIVKIEDNILSDLLTPLPDGSTKVQLYAETLNSKLGPITYFNQSDYRWAKYKYGHSSYMYSSGCGPTIMAMIINTFSPQAYITPKETADFAYSKGCYVKGGGSTHDIVKKCCDEYKIPVKVIKANKENIESALKNKKLLVALVGKGEFTTGGHFILITGLEKNGKLSIADSISLDNTHKKWDTDFIISQLKKSVSAGPLWEIG